MAETLVIRLHAGPPAGAADASTAAPWADWIVVDQFGAPRGRAQSGELAAAAATAATHRCLVLVPGTDVLLAEPVLPLKGGAKLAQVVPFALEEQLADDVEDLHFAVGKRGNTPGTPVAVVAHQRMAQWQAQLSAVGIVADALYAETAVLPQTPNGVTLVVEQQRVYVRREHTPGAVLDVEPLIEALQLALASGDEAREHVTIYLTEADYERERDLLEGLREFTASLQIKLVPHGILALLATHAVATPPVNLLQGRYQAKRKSAISFAPWRYVAALAAVFVALHLGLTGWQFVKLRATELQLDEQIVTEFQRALPGAPMPPPADARRSIEARLGALRGTGPAGGMLPTLAVLSEALTQAPGTQIEALAYRQDVTDLRVLTPSIDALDKLQHAATERGMTAQIQSTGARASQTEARLQLRKAGS